MPTPEEIAAGTVGSDGELWNADYRAPGQSVPTPDAPMVPAMPSGPTGEYPPAPIIAVDSNSAGSIDPAADRVCAWWMNRQQADTWGPMLRTQFDPNGPLYPLNQQSLRAMDQPLYLPSTALSMAQMKSVLWSLIGATLAYNLPPAGKRMGAKIGWSIAGFFFPTLTTGAVAARQIFR